MSGDIIVGAAKHARDWVDYWTLGATISGALILLAYTIAAFRQVSLTARVLREAEKSRQDTAAAALRADKATQESNKIAVESMELGNRAWMVATDIERLTLVTGPARKLWVNTENLGRIPAIDVGVRGLAFTFTGPPLPDLPDDLNVPSTGYYASRAVAGPGRGLQGKIQLGALTDDIVARIGSGEVVMFAICVIEYTDWFKVTRETTACWQYNRDDGSWAAAPKHNRMK